MAEKREQQMKEITERLEQGVKELFTSEMYTEYLNTMSKFHNYSFNNTLLIAMQKPDATLVAGFQAWQKKFNRHVKRGEKAIQIIAPAPIREKQDMEKIDPETQEPVLRSDGQPETEEVEIVIPRFRITSVFDVSQTEGEPLAELDTPELIGSVENVSIFMQAIETVSPVPIRFERIESEAKGYYSNTDKEIAIQEGMSESQTMKTAVHEVTHAMLHDKEIMQEQGVQKNQMTKEVEAESVAYTVCQYFGLDTSDYSFPYIAGWSSGMDMRELRTSMETIRKTAGEFIDLMVDKIREIQKEIMEEREIQMDDVILCISGSMGSEYEYCVIENMSVGQLEESVRDYARLTAEDAFLEEGDFLQEYLIERGAGVFPVFASDGLGEEYPIDFFDVQYDVDTGVTVATELSPQQQAEMLIARAEYRASIFNDEERSLIVNYAFKFDDMEDTKALLRELTEAMEAPDFREVREVMNTAQAEIDALPDGMIGISEMHQFGYYNDSVLPLTMGRAVELHHAGANVYRLQVDGSRTLMNTEQDILEQEGIFGIEAREWQSFQVMESVQKERLEERNSEKYQEVELFGKRALFLNGRVDLNEIQEGLHRYELRGSDADPGFPVSVETSVTVNHAGTLIMAEKLSLSEQGFLYLEEGGLNFTGAMLTIPEYRIELEHEREDLLFGENEERYGIYQLEDGEKPTYHFMGLDFVRKQGLVVAGNDYKFVYGDVLQEGETLDSLYDKFNLERPDDFFGHSLSVSDVIILNKNGEQKAYYVDSFGFEELPQFVQERKVTLEIPMEPKIEDKQPQGNEYPPVYLYPLTYATEHAAADAYLDSRKLNMDCKRAIEGAIREHFDGMHLAHDAAVQALETYGAERVTFVLANTIQHLASDGRFSRENKAWAEQFEIPENISRGMDLNDDYTVSSHPAVLDGFIGLAREGIEERIPQQERKAQVDEKTRGLVVDGHFGSWHTAEIQEVKGEKLYRMEHDDYGDSVASIIVNADGKLVAEDLEHGFDEGAMEAIEEYFADKAPDTELAYWIDAKEQYFTIQTVTDGYDYTFYKADYREWDGGVYDNPDISIREAMEEILSDEGLFPADCEVIDYDELQEKVESVVQADQQKARLAAKEKMPLISDKTVPETALNGQSRAEIEETVLCYAQAQIDEMGLKDEVELLGARVYGSRCRAGLYSENSDMDVVVSYSGNLREDDFFNILHEDGMLLNGLPVDITPISVEKTGTLAEYMEQAEAYLDEKEKQITEKAVTMLPEPEISFYVAECMEFPILGELHEDLTFQEAVKLYQQIPAERMNGGKGIGFCLKDGSIYNEMTHELMIRGESSKENINEIAHYRESPLVQKAIADMEEVLSTWNDKDREQSESVAPEKTGKKQSVLKALRERQVKIKAQEQEKPEQKVQARKKGEAEL